MKVNLEFSFWIVSFALGLSFFLVSIHHFLIKSNHTDMTDDAYACFFAFLASFVLTFPDVLFVKYDDIELIPYKTSFIKEE